MDYRELTVKIIRKGDERDAEEWFLISEPPFEKFDAAAIWDEFSELLRHDKRTPWAGSHVIDEHRRVDQRAGASGYWWELVVETWGVPGAVVGYGLKVALDRLTDRLGVREVAPLDRDRALNTARWAVLQGTPSLQGEQLGEPSGEEYDAERQRWSFTYRPGIGYEYVVEVGWHGRLPGVVRTVRRRDA